MKEAKATGKFQINMDRLPIFVYNQSLELGQSKTIERFVARKLGFMGESEEEAAQIDMITEHIRDIKQKYNDAKAGKIGEELSTAKSLWIANELPGWLLKLEKSIPGANAPFAVGKASLADIVIQQLIHDYFDDKEGAIKATDGLAKVGNSVSIINQLGRNYFDKRPVTKF
jgi:glutathione S-transferase